MYLITVSRYVATLECIVLILGISALVAELTTEEDLSKQIVIPTLVILVITTAISTYTLMLCNRKLNNIPR
jgi:Ca2+/Na+ antiporter